VINAALLTSAWSAASGDLYIASRGLCERLSAFTSTYLYLNTVYLQMASPPPVTPQKSFCVPHGPGFHMSQSSHAPLSLSSLTWLSTRAQGWYLHGSRTCALRQVSRRGSVSGSSISASAKVSSHKDTRHKISLFRRGFNRLLRGGLLSCRLLRCS
jgi:hypothetical protein